MSDDKNHAQNADIQILMLLLGASRLEAAQTLRGQLGEEALGHAKGMLQRVHKVAAEHKTAHGGTYTNALNEVLCKPHVLAPESAPSLSGSCETPGVSTGVPDQG
ncbi:hypothetical protein, partial [Kibdelosporangium philippinense]|uniref:hypothetical protein n=1 Tax=Kibdelosporangium philippinense TaxID=211113 RepID=UPI0035E5E551